METQEGYLDPTCPRCGYDQSGEAATWENACPIEGTCPECGHGFAWADLFDPSRRDLPWSVESVVGIWGWLRRTPGMVLRMLLPWRYWREVNVGIGVKPKRLVGWLAVLALGMQLMTWPIVVIGFGEAIYGNGIIGFWKTISDMPASEILEFASNGMCYPVAIFEWNSSQWWFFLFEEPIALFMRFLVGFCLVWMFVMLAVPTSRSLAKLRPTHVYRAALLQLSPVVLLYFMMRVGFWGTALGWYEETRSVSFVLATLGTVWSVLWWAAAIRSGWKIKSWPLLLLGTIAALLGGTVMTTIEDSIWFLFR